ncbi:MAG: ATP-binding protein [Rickettsiales bacterium]
MLIEFSVENYRSIKERQTLSMVTTESVDKNGRCVIDTNFNAASTVLANAAIYGPNSSGKSNLIDAMGLFQKFVVNSHKLQQTETIDDIVPFLFSKRTQKQPSSFEVVFIHNGHLFQYGFAIDKNKIHDEWLYATPEGKQKQKPQTWFERNSKNMKESTIRRQLKGAKESWKEGTGENQLFLSVASNRQSEDFRKPFDWIQNSFNVLTNPELLHHGYTAGQIHKNGKKDAVMKFMKDLDVSFDDIEIVEKEIVEGDFKDIKELPEELRKKLLKEMVGKKRPEIFTLHKMEDGGYYLLQLEEESDGTKQLFAFAAPILDVLENGYTLVVDELHNSLHPLALKGVVSMFQNEKINTKNAQLIFTTHDTSAMNYLSRDQIWLLDKGKFGDAIFTALSEFKDKKDVPTEKRYLGGRYGALPNVKGIT